MPSRVVARLLGRRNGELLRIEGGPANPFGGPSSKDGTAGLAHPIAELQVPRPQELKDDGAKGPGKVGAVASAQFGEFKDSLVGLSVASLRSGRRVPLDPASDLPLAALRLGRSGSG